MHVDGRKLVRGALAYLKPGHLGWVALVLAFVVKEWMILNQLGAALHHNFAVRLVISTVGLMLLMTPWARLLGGRGQLLGLLGINVALTVLSYGALLHYREFGALPSVAQLRGAQHLTEVGGAVGALVRGGDLLLFADIAALLVLLFLPSAGGLERLTRREALGFSGAGAAMILLVAFNTNCLSKTFFGRSYIAGDLGLAGYYVWDAISVAERALARGKPLPPEKIEEVRQRLLASYEPTNPETYGVAVGRNVIFLQVESLQGFALGLQVNGQPITPHLDALAQESMRSERFFHITAKGRSSDAQFASNCSLLPSMRGATVYEYESNTFFCLPSILAASGYETYVFQALGPDFWNASIIGAKMGFHRTFSDQDFEIDEWIGLALSDRSFLRQTLEHLEDVSEPFYAFILTTTSHTPYDTAGIERKLELGSLEGTTIGNYLHTIHYTDQAIGDFIQSLRARGVLDRSILVVTGDHDAMTRREGGLDRFLPIDPEDEEAWFATEKRVGLMIRLPHGKGANLDLGTGSQLDLAPTLLSLLGKPRERTVMLGTDLLGRSEEERVAVFPNGAALGSSAFYLSSEATLGAPRCFVGGEVRDVSACAELAERAEELGSLSVKILDGDLIPALLSEPDVDGPRVEQVERK